MTNESEAMEVWRKVFTAWDRAEYTSEADQAAARVIATALDARDARIAKLEGALEAEVIFHEAKAKELSKQPPQADRNWRMMEHRERRDELRAILTKGNTHD